MNPNPDPNPILNPNPNPDLNPNPNRNSNPNPGQVAEAVCALLGAGWLMGSEVPELRTLHQLFTAKYGKAYSEEVINNKEKYLSHRLLRMLTSTQVPDPT